MKKLFLLLVICFPFLSFAHGSDEFEIGIDAKGVKLSGTLTMPSHAHGAVPLVIIIAGSCPTDRDCNVQGFKSDAYKNSPIIGPLLLEYLSPITFTHLPTRSKVSLSLDECFCAQMG